MSQKHQALRRTAERRWLTFSRWTCGAGKSAVLILDEVATEADVLMVAGIQTTHPDRHEEFSQDLK